MNTYHREIACVRHGTLYMWSWTEGDNPLVANWQALFKKLRTHQKPWKGCYLRFKEDVSGIQVPAEGLVTNPMKPGKSLASI